MLGNVNSMKIKLFIIATLFYCNLNASDYGVKVGMNYSTLGGESTILSPQYVPDFNFGFIAILPLYDRIDLQIEMLYDTYGYDFSVDIYNSTGVYSGEKEVSLRYKYLNMPFVVSIHILEFETDRSNIYLGSNIAYLINATSNIEFEREPNFPEENSNKINYGFMLGTNYILNIAENRFLIDARYYFSLNPINKNSEWDDGHHKSISLAVGYLW
jgi:hypothetical protein